MTRYLIVADQTAGSPELVTRAKQLADDTPGSTFALLLPAHLPAHLRAALEDTESERRADRSRALLADAGLDVSRVVVGDASPLLAIEDELRDQADGYDAIVLCTLPAGISRWLRMGIVEQARERFGLPVLHIEAQLPSRLEFRRAMLRDHERIQALWEESRLETVDEDEWDTLIASPGAVVLVAEEEGAIVGAIVATFDGWRAYIYHVAVVPGRRRRGVAQALFAEAHAHLAREGNRIVYVMVNEDNEGGLGLLASLGYQSHGDTVMMNYLEN